MKTKSKVISRVIAIVLALVMAVSSGITVFAAGLGALRQDKATTVGKNWLDWVELLNEDACEALLDGADEWLKDLDLTYLASSGIKDDVHTLPMVMPIDSSMNSMLTDKGFVHVFLGNQKLADGTYPTGGSTGTSDSSNSSTTTAPGRTRVYLFVKVQASAAFITLNRTMKVEGYVDSIDGIIDLLIKLYTQVINNSDLKLNLLVTTIDFLSIAGGDQVVRLRTSLSLLSTLNSTTYYTSTSETSRCGKSWRKKLGAKQTMKYIAQLLDALGSDNNANNLLYTALSGTLELGALNDTVGLYYKPGDDKTGQEARDDGIIGGLVTGEKAPIWDQYETNGYLLYNALAAYVMNHELPTTDGSAYYGIDEDGNKLYTVPSSGALTSGTYKLYGSSSTTAWNYDDVICDCISRYVLQNINIDVTYPEYVQNEDGKWVHDSSRTRFERDGSKYDSNLVLNEKGNVYLFRYGTEKLWLKKTDNLYDFAMRALKIAWKTALKPTLHLLQINYNGHEIDGKGTNFDNKFLDWYIANKATGTVRSFPGATAYTDGSVEEWAADVYADYGAADAAEFLENVENTYDYDEARKAKNDKYNWRDIEVTTLWNQVRYSPLADKYFGRRTGPANLYFLQTGTSNIDAFMDAVAAGTKTYAGIPEALNDFLIAAVGDLFPNSANIGYNNASSGEFENIAAPTGFTEASTFDATTIMNNIYKVLEYVGNCTNANLFNPYYAKNAITYDGSTVNLTANNIEEAIIPFAISALKQWNMTATIHNSDWDKVNSIESGAIVALQEYLGYVFPDRDYSTLWTLQEVAIPNTEVSYKYIVAKSGEDLYENVILWMARDAAAYAVVAAGVPMTKLDTNRTPWDPYTMSALNTTSSDSTIFALADSVVCYFLACGETFDKSGTNAPSKGIAALFNLGTSTIASSKSLWTNLDSCFNSILPVVGELQYVNGAYKGSGSFSSSAFVQDTLIADVMSLNLTDLFDGLYRILSATPIKSRAVNKVLYYNILAPVVNSILGANSLNSGSSNLIPTADVTNPIDTFLLPANIRGSSYTNGILSRLIKNLRLYFDGSASEYFYNVATFALMTFGFPGQLSEQDLNGVDIKVFNSDVFKTGASVEVKIKNDSYGINRFFHNQGDLDSSKQYEASRYWVKINSVALQNAAGSSAGTMTAVTTAPYTSQISSSMLAPEKNAYYTAAINSSVARDNLVKVVVNYDILFDNTLTNGSTTAASAPSTTIASGITATKWIYVTPSSYTEAHANQADETFSGTDFKTKDGAITGSVVTASANNIAITAGSMYDVSCNDVASEGYGVRIVNSGTAKATGKFYLAPITGTAYNLRANGNAATAAAALAPQLAYLAIDEEGNIYNKDGSVLVNIDDTKTGTTYAWIIGYHKTTNLDGEEIYDYILANAMNAPADVAFGAPGAGTTIADVTELGFNDTANDEDNSQNNFALFKSGATQAAKYTVQMVFATSGTARTAATPITIAYKGDMDGLRWAVDHYTEVLGATNATVQAGAKAACVTYRNSTTVDAWTNADKLADAIYKAGESAAKTRAETITTFNESRDGLDEVDYKIVGFHRFVKYAQAAEALREQKPIVELDENDEPVLDEDGNEIPVLDSKGRPTYEYKTAEPAWKVNEYVRVANLYKGYMEERAHDLTRINAEIAHATSLCDDYDELIAASANDVSKFTATATTAARHYVVLDEKGVPALDDNDLLQYADGDVAEYRFAYSTKDRTVADNIKVYEVGTTATDVKFGAVENGKLVNKGEVKYTDDSWNAYIDALGEVITSINAGEEISKTYTATTHLVMAENELEPVEGGDNITVSGKVLIAADINGNTGNFGLRGVVVAALDGEGNVVAQTVSDAGADSSAWGDYTLEVPAGTTRFVVGDPVNADTIANREFTIAGDADVTDANVPVVMCDYNDDGYVNNTDTGQYGLMLKGSYSIYADFNIDGYVNNTDTGQYGLFLKGCKNGVVYGSELSF